MELEVIRVASAPLGPDDLLVRVLAAGGEDGDAGPLVLECGGRSFAALTAAPGTPCRATFRVPGALAGAVGRGEVRLLRAARDDAPIPPPSSPLALEPLVAELRGRAERAEAEVLALRRELADAREGALVAGLRAEVRAELAALRAELAELRPGIEVRRASPASGVAPEELPAPSPRPLAGDPEALRAGLERLRAPAVAVPTAGPRPAAPGAVATPAAAGLDLAAERLRRAVPVPRRPLLARLLAALAAWRSVRRDG